MSKTIYIVDRKGSFSEEWIRFCKMNALSYELVDPYQPDLICRIKNGRCFLWHWRHDSHKDKLFARQLFSALAVADVGLQTYPNIKTCWHFDDKIGQKYLFEVAGIPAARSYVFYDQKTALAWLDKSSYPIVFKLRGGAGALNVRLVSTKKAAIQLTKKAFSNGFAYFERWEIFKQSIWRARRDRNLRSLAALVYHLGRALIPFVKDGTDLHSREIGYVYFQEFIPNNTFDDRLVVVGDSCFAVRRFCRTGDFRASGSGLKNYDSSVFPKHSIALAFKIADALKMQSVAIDLVYKPDGEPTVVEVSYGFVTSVYPGYFDRELQWHEKKTSAPELILENLLRSD
jgi:hypothetical protein